MSEPTIDPASPPDAAPETAPPATSEDATGTADATTATPSPSDAAPEQAPAGDISPIADGTPAPEAPVIEVPANGQESADSHIVVSGTGEPGGAIVTVYADAQVLGGANIDDTGNWSVEGTLPNAEYVLTAVTSDQGRLSEASEPVTVTVNYPEITPPAPEPTDPEERLLAFLKEKILGGYPMRWEIIFELRQHSQAWIDSKESS